MSHEKFPRYSSEKPSKNPTNKPSKWWILGETCDCHRWCRHCDAWELVSLEVSRFEVPQHALPKWRDIYLLLTLTNNHNWGDELWGFSFTNSFLQHPQNRTNMALPRSLILFAANFLCAERWNINKVTTALRWWKWSAFFWAYFCHFWNRLIEGDSQQSRCVVACFLEVSNLGLNKKVKKKDQELDFFVLSSSLKRVFKKIGHYFW